MYPASPPLYNASFNDASPGSHGQSERKGDPLKKLVEVREASAISLQVKSYIDWLVLKSVPRVLSVQRNCPLDKTQSVSCPMDDYNGLSQKNADHTHDFMTLDSNRHDDMLDTNTTRDSTQRFSTTNTLNPQSISAEQNSQSIQVESILYPTSAKSRPDHRSSQEIPQRSHEQYITGEWTKSEVRQCHR